MGCSCISRITISHKEESKLKELKDKIEYWLNQNNYMEHTFRGDWLGNIVLGAEIGTVDAGKDTDLRCRGTVDDMELCDNQLLINTSTSHVPMMKMWAKLLEKYIPDAELIFESEDGYEYKTNDPELKGKYIIDAFDVPDMDSCWDCEEKFVIKDLQQLLNTKESELNTLLNLLENSDFNDKYAVRKWDFVDISELD